LPSARSPIGCSRDNRFCFNPRVLRVTRPAPYAARAVNEIAAELSTDLPQPCAIVVEKLELNVEVRAVDYQALAPFQITICGLDELACHCAGGVTHVLSILDPGWPEP